MSQRYEKRGVSASKKEVHDAVADLDQGLYPNAFCKVLPDHLSGDPERCFLIHADGAGTKSALAYAYWKETGDLSVWRGIAQDALVMNVDDILCVGGTGPFMASSTIGRNKRLVPGEVISELVGGSEAFLEKLRELGIEAYHCGGETADIGDLVRSVVVDSTVSTSMDRQEVISNDGIEAGDLIVGLASSGKASYEEAYNSGIGSNGLTAARHDLLSPQVGEQYPETVDPGLPEDVRYVGPYRLTDPAEGTPLDIGQALLSPTRTYAPIVKELLQEMRDRIHGMVHCSGGGQTKVLNFVEDLHVKKTDLFEIPPVFELIQNASASSGKEMYQVFNMGHRMELFVPDEASAQRIIDIAGNYDVEAKVIGHCETSDRGKALTLESPLGTFHY